MGYLMIAHIANLNVETQNSKDPGRRRIVRFLPIVRLPAILPLLCNIISVS